MTVKLRVLAGVMKYNDDPYLLAADPLCSWQKTERGKFIIDNAVQSPEFKCETNSTLNYSIFVTAELAQQKAVEYMLKYGDVEDGVA